MKIFTLIEHFTYYQTQPKKKLGNFDQTLAKVFLLLFFKWTLAKVTVQYKTGF